jgi:hypothetical protein
MFRAKVLKRSSLLFAAALVALTVGACDDDDSNPLQPTPVPVPQALVVANGDITASVLGFRALLGEPNNGTTAGEQTAGRREIGWDGAGANPFNNRNDFPADFFNQQSKSGAVFTTSGTGFRNDSTLFVDVDASYGTQFNFFSANRIFSPVGSAEMDINFRVAGEATPGVVTGFGIVFVDVDKEGTTSIEPFDRNGKSLGVFKAPVRSDAKGLSFVGVKFDNPIIARVRIRAGDAALLPGRKDLTAGGTADLVVMDNFLYGEPHK